MPVGTLPFETWRSVVEALRADGLPPSMAEHADGLERALDGHAPDDPAVSLALSNDAFLHSHNWAWLHLGIPLPPIER